MTAPNDHLAPLGLATEYGIGINAKATVQYQAFGRVIATRTGTDTTYLLADHVGSTVGTVSADGSEVHQVRYWPYGKVRSGGVGTDKLYTGQQMEASGALGAYFYHARFYSTTLGTFLSPDPTSAGLDRFAYTHNPLSVVDPSGLTPACPGCLDDSTTGIACVSGANACSLQEPVTLHPLAALSDFARWWGAYFNIDPALILAVIAWESGQQGLMERLYNEIAYAGLRFGGEPGMRAAVDDMNAAGAFFHLGQDAEPDWGIANITLSNAQAVMDLIPEGLRPNRAIDIVDALRTPGGAVMFAAAIMRDNMKYVSSASALTVSEQLVVLYSTDKVFDYKQYYAGTQWVGPTRNTHGQYVPGALNGQQIGTQGAAFLNHVMPLVDQARATIAYCTSIACQ